MGLSAGTPEKDFGWRGAIRMPAYEPDDPIHATDIHHRVRSPFSVSMQASIRSAPAFGLVRLRPTELLQADPMTRHALLGATNPCDPSAARRNPALALKLLQPTRNHFACRSNFGRYLGVGCRDGMVAVCKLQQESGQVQVNAAKRDLRDNVRKIVDPSGIGPRTRLRISAKMSSFPLAQGARGTASASGRVSARPVPQHSSSASERQSSG